MKGSKFRDARMAFVLKQRTDGMPGPETCRKAGISQMTYFNRMKKYEELVPEEMRWLKQLEARTTSFGKWPRISSWPGRNSGPLAKGRIHLSRLMPPAPMHTFA